MPRPSAAAAARAAPAPTPASTPFIRTTLTLGMPLPMAYIGRELEGATLGLNELLTRYHSGIKGVLVAYAKPRFEDAPPASIPHCSGGLAYSASHARQPLGHIIDELPVLHVRVTVDALVFRPRLGQILHGSVVSLSSGHVGMLVAGLYNASVAGADMAGAYAYREAAHHWEATPQTQLAAASSSADAAAGGGKKRRRPSTTDATTTTLPPNRIVAANPAVLREGADVVFRLTSLGYAAGVLQMFGCFEDADAGEAMPRMLGGAEGCAPVAGGSTAVATAGEGALFTSAPADVSSDAAPAVGASSEGKKHKSKRARVDGKEALPELAAKVAPLGDEVTGSEEAVGDAKTPKEKKVKKRR